MRSHHMPNLTQKMSGNNIAQWFAPVGVLRNNTPNGGGSKRCDIPVEIIGDKQAEDQNEPGPISCLLLCTKANDAIPALQSVWSRLASVPTSPSPRSKMIILSNGALAIHDSIQKNFAGHLDGVQIVLGTTTHGAHRAQSATPCRHNNEHYSIVHAGEGSTHCADKDFVRICQSVGWDSTVLTEFDMAVMLWKKLAVNCVINPLTAIHGVKNGELAHTKHLGQDIEVVAKLLLEEVSFVAMKEMESLFERAQCQGDAELQSVRKELSVPALEQFVFEVMTATKDNVSSMLQDVRAKRTTEVEFINGYVASLGQEKYGVECPLNMEMCKLVEELNYTR